MINLYNKNGLVHWTQKEIRIREILRDYFVAEITEALYKLNKAWTFHQCDAPILQAPILSPPNVRNEELEVYNVLGERNNERIAIHDYDRPLCLRPETTKGSYVYADWLQQNPQSIKLPLGVYQYGKSFRREQDQPTKFMRLKEFYQLEFQCIYSEGTKCDYFAEMSSKIHALFSKMIGYCEFRDSDRLPSYSRRTIDIHVYIPNELEKEGMELCSISERTDYAHPVLEIAIGMDRCVYKFLE